MSRFIHPDNIAKYKQYLADVEVEDKYVARVDGSVVSIVSPVLVAIRSISDEVLEKIVAGHINRFNICMSAQQLSDHPHNVSALHILYTQFIDNEELLQQLWGFDVNSNYQAGWEFPHCSCPKLDNRERMGTPHKIVNSTCVIHNSEI